MPNKKIIIIIIIRQIDNNTIKLPGNIIEEKIRLLKTEYSNQIQTKNKSSSTK